jgi:diacylglycerol kinase (ATP)
VDDGQLDVCLVRDIPLHRAFRLIPRILAGRHTDAAEVEVFRSNWLEITSPDTVPAVADGEPAGATPVRIAVEPAALRTMTPA